MAKLIEAEWADLPVAGAWYPIHMWSHKPSGYYAKRIEAVTGKPTHSMLAVGFNTVASHEWVLRYRSLEDYIQGKHELWWWEPPYEVGIYQVLEQIQEEVEKDVSVPWYFKRYDWLGVVGQLLRIPKLHLPWSWYCSEWTGSLYLNVLFCRFPKLWENLEMHEREDWAWMPPSDQFDRIHQYARGNLYHWNGVKK